MSENKPSIKTVWNEMGEVYEISIDSPPPQLGINIPLILHSSLPLPDCDMADLTDAQGQHWAAPNSIDPN